MLTLQQQRLVNTLTKVQLQPVEEDALPKSGRSSLSEAREVLVDHIPMTAIQQRHVDTIAKLQRKKEMMADQDNKGVNEEDPRDIILRGKRLELARQQEEMPTIGGGSDGGDRDDSDGSISPPPVSDDDLRDVGAREEKTASELTVVLNDDDSYTYSNGVCIDPTKYRPIYTRANLALFDYLDEFHLNVEDTKDETYQYNARDVTVINKLEIPVAINVANSSVKFEFKTQEGDIGFGVVFAAYLDPPDEDEQDGGDAESTADNAPEMEYSMLYAERIVRSDVPDEPIKGTFTVDEPGVLFFLFNNEHEWVADKHISYQIDVVKPIFEQPDEERCAISIPLLDECVVDLADSRDRHLGAVELITQDSASVEELEGAIARLEADMRGLHSELNEAAKQMNHAKHMLERCEQVKPGLCVRTLQKRELYHLLMFVPGEASLVCKYWSDLVCNHGLNFSDRRDLLDSSPRRQRISANNRETAAMPLPGKPKPPTRRYPGMVSRTGSISSHGTGQASIGTGRGNTEKMMSSHGGAGGINVMGDSYWPSEDEEEGDDPAGSKPYSAEHFQSIYAYNKALPPSRTSSSAERDLKAKVRLERATVTPGRALAPSPEFVSVEHLSPRGYKPEDFATLYGAPPPKPSVSSSSPQIPSSQALPRPAPVTAAAVAGAKTNSGAERKEDDRIVMTNARTKTPSPSPTHTYNYRARPRQEAPAAEGKRKGDGDHGDDDADSLDGVVTPAKTLSRANEATRGSASRRQHAAPKPDPAAVVRLIDQCFEQDEDYEAQRAALKQKLSVWCQIFEEKRHRPPSVKEKRRLTKDLYADYQEVRVQQARNFERINELLGSIGISLREYKQLSIGAFEE